MYYVTKKSGFSKPAELFNIFMT